MPYWPTLSTDVDRHTVDELCLVDGGPGDGNRTNIHCECTEPGSVSAYC